MKFLVAVGLLVLVAAASATTGWNDCGSVGSSEVEFDIVGCDQAPCFVTAGNFMTVKIVIPSAEKETSTLHNVVMSVQDNGIEIDITDAVGITPYTCDYIQPSCPIELGNRYTIETTLLSDEYFTGSINARIKPYDDDYEDFVCIEVNVVFVSPEEP